MSIDNDIHQRLSSLAGIGINDTVRSLLKALEMAKIEAIKATTPESIKNHVQQLQELTYKLSYKSRESSNVEEQIALQPELKNAYSLIQELNERKSRLEMKEGAKKLSGLPQKSTSQAVQDLTEAKRELSSTKTANDLKNSIDHLKIAIRVVIDKMEESSGKEKLNLYEEIRRATQFLENYKVQQTPKKTLNNATSFTPMATSKLQSQNFQLAKQEAHSIQGNSSKPPVIKGLTKAQEVTQQKQSPMNPLYKNLERAKFEADKAKTKAIDAIKNYRQHKTPQTRREALTSLKIAKTKKGMVDSLQKQIQKLETICGKTVQLKNAIHNFKEAQQSGSKNKLERNNPRFRP